MNLEQGQGKTSLPKVILVAVEGSEPSLRESSMKASRYALELASMLDATLAGVCVVQIPDYIEENTRAVLRDELFRNSQKALDEIGELASKSGVKFRSRTVETSGGISSAICSHADEEGADLIVLGTRSGTSALSKMMLGSVASGVTSNASCPVLVIR